MLWTGFCLHVPFDSQEWSISNFSCSLTGNYLTTHNMENLTFHHLLRWKLIILPTIPTSLIYIFRARNWEKTFSHISLLEMMFVRVKSGHIFATIKDFLVARAATLLTFATVLVAVLSPDSILEVWENVSSFWTWKWKGNSLASDNDSLFSSNKSIPPRFFIFILCMQLYLWNTQRCNMSSLFPVNFIFLNFQAQSRWECTVPIKLNIPDALYSSQ